MTPEWIFAFLLSVSIATVQGEQTCTYREEAETEGNRNDWRESKSVATPQLCREFCSSVPQCKAAEFRHSDNNCYLFKGPTTLRYNKDSLFMVKKCKEVTTVEDIPMVSTTSVRMSTPASTTPEPTTSTAEGTSTFKKVPLMTTKPSVQSTSSQMDPLPREGNVHNDIIMTSTYGDTDDLSTLEEMRSKRSPSTQPLTITKNISKRLTAKKVRTPFRRTIKKRKKKKKTKLPASLMVKMLYKSSVTDNAPFEYTSEAPTTPLTFTKEITTPIKVTTRKQRIPQTHVPTYKNSTTELKTSPVGTNITIFQMSGYTTPLPIHKPKTLKPKPARTIQVSKAIELKITDSKEDVHINADTSTKPQSLFRVSMRTSRYKPATFGRVRSRHMNRVDVPTADPRQPDSSTIRRRCFGLCSHVYGLQSRYGVFVPFMKVYTPMMVPQYRTKQTRAGFNPLVRFRIPIRFRLPSYFRTPYGQQFPVQTPWGYSRRQHIPYGYGSFPPQHAAVAHYGRQPDPWANNFRRASLKTAKTHHVAVIPGRRYQPVLSRHRPVATRQNPVATRQRPVATRQNPVATRQRPVATRRRVYEQPYEYKPKPKPTPKPTPNPTPKTPITTPKPIPIKKPIAEIRNNTNVNDEAKSHNQENEPRVKLPSRTHIETSSPQNDQQWQLKSHYNTYTLRLKLPMPISGYKRCFQRNQLPPPPKILVVAFQADGSFSAKAIPVSYPRRVCSFIKPGKMYPELHLPSSLVIFTGTSFIKDTKELRKIYVATSPKAQYDVTSLQAKSTMERYISVYNTPPIFRQLKIPIDISRAMVSFDMARMGFIYRLTVRLPRALMSRNLMVEDSISSDIPFKKISPETFMHPSLSGQ